MRMRKGRKHALGVFLKIVCAAVALAWTTNSTRAQTESFELVLQPGPIEGKDSFVTSAPFVDRFGNRGGGEPSENFGDNPYLPFGGSSPYWQTKTIRSYLEFNLDQIPEGAQVLDVSLWLWQHHGHVDTTTVNLHTVTWPWDEETITWDNQPMYDDRVLASIDDIQPKSWHEFKGPGLTEQVERWVQREESNYGLLIKVEDEEWDGADGFYSSDNPDASRRPQLRVSYCLPDTTAPEVDCFVSPDSLWPANHKMVEVDVCVIAEDESSAPEDLSLVAAFASSNEPDNGLGDGDTEGDVNGEGGYTARVDVTAAFTDEFTTPDGQRVFAGTIELRAERGGGGGGRIYTIEAFVEDGAGNVGSCSCEVKVPHDKGKGKKAKKQ